MSVDHRMMDGVFDVGDVLETEVLTGGGDRNCLVMNAKSRAHWHDMLADVPRATTLSVTLSQVIGS